MVKLWSIMLLVGVALGLGCKSTATSRRLLVPAYEPTNVYVRKPGIPADILRVAVLPFPRTGKVQADTASRTALEPILVAELRKRKRFELIQVTPDQLNVWTGKSAWVAAENLPTGFLSSVREHTGCDAVLFAALTTYHPYPPLSIGWSVKLADCREGQIWWSVDEVFDAGNQSVAAAAEAYGRKEMMLPAPLLENSAILDSPRRFGQYTAWAVASTMPTR